MLNNHAYLIIGNNTNRLNLIDVLENRYGVSSKKNSDYFDQVYESLSIYDARALKSLHSIRPIDQSGKKIFIITTNSVTHEAQNALLKLLEDPAEYAHFFLIVPSAHILLSTIKSRMMEVNDSLLPISAQSRSTFICQNKSNTNKTSEQIHNMDEALVFLRISPAKRIEMIKKFVDDINKDKRTKQNAIDFLNTVQIIVYENKEIKNRVRLLEIVETVRKYVYDRAPSMKMLLEYVALNV